MNRDEFIRWLRLDNMTISAIEAFYRGLPARVPKGASDEAVAVRAAVESRLGKLNAAMLGRDHDPRVSVDIEAMSTQIAERLDRYGSSDWDANIDTVRQTIGEISADLRAVDGGADEDEDD